MGRVRPVRNDLCALRGIAVRTFEQFLLMNEHPAACVGVCDTPDLGCGVGRLRVAQQNRRWGEEQQLSCSNC
ncbi:hypothetical protein ABH922_003331 [Rhodococcus sp. 27YEA15]